MTVTVSRFQAEKISADAAVVFLQQDTKQFKEQSARVQEVWPAAANVLSTQDFVGGKESVAVVYTGNKKLPRLLLVGIGEGEKISAERIRRLAAIAAQRALSLKASSLAIVVPTGFASAENAQALVEGARLGTYSFDKYFTESVAKQPRVKLTKLQLAIEEESEVAAVKRGVAAGTAVANGVLFARDLINAPSNEIYPETLVARTKEELTPLGVKVTSFDKKKIEQLKMGGLLAVNQGSLRPPFFMIMEWNGGKKGEKPIVLVGKGLTFDSGGISIKPAAGMGDMKMDMGGAGAVIGTMRSIAEMKVARNVVALVPTTENMPSGSAFKPGDVITFANGKTAEIDNTDAEGRLVLADALTYASRYEPQAVIDVATLTGAVVIALGNVASGLMGNDRALLDRIRESGDRTYDRVVELPLWEEFEELIRSDIADVKNSGGRAAGTITAGLFLQHFIGEYPWAHIDIAGSGMIPRANGYLNKGGTGAAVRLLVDLVQQWNQKG